MFRMHAGNRFSLLVLLVFVAFLTRINGIGTVPPSLNWDEVSHGYNAYSILSTGMDEWGVKFPIIFRAYGDYKLPVYIYLTVVSEYFLGLSILSVRLVSVLAGSLSVGFVYLLTLEIFRHDKRRNFISFGAAVLMALEPWSFFLSRGAFEANLALFFVIAGFYFLLGGMRRSSFHVLIGVLFLGLSVWSYNSARVFVPLMLVVYAVLYFGFLKRLWSAKPKVMLMATVLAAVLFLPMFWQLMRPEGTARFGWVSILDQGAISEIESLRNDSSFSKPLSRMLYNRFSYLAYKIGDNYISHYGVDFLFLNGGSNYQFSIPSYGLLYLVDLPFVIWGLFKLIGKRDRNYMFILFWLILAPVPASLTRDAPHALRSIFMLPVPMILSSLGLSDIYGRVRRKRVGFALAGVYALLFLFFAIDYRAIYFTSYRVDFSKSWQFGYNEAVDYIHKHYDDYDKVVITKKYGEPHEFLLFWWPWNPQAYRVDPNLVRFNQTNWYWVDRFDKFYFVNDWEIEDDSYNFVTESDLKIDCEFKKCLLVTGENFEFEKWNLLKEINYLDGSDAFRIYENFE